MRLNFLILIVLVLTTPFALAEDKKTKEQNKIEAKTSETLERLYEIQPKSKEVIPRAQGSAGFSNFGMKILVAGGGKGQGVAINNKTGKHTYMKMLELQAGLGMGIKKFSVVFVFDNASVFNKFVNSGWELGGQTTAAAKLDDTGASLSGAISVSPGVWMYQLTDDGLALELTMKGTKYMKDDDLN